jgi:hypothetical protein
MKGCRKVDARTIIGPPPCFSILTLLYVSDPASSKGEQPCNPYEGHSAKTVPLTSLQDSW